LDGTTRLFDHLMFTMTRETREQIQLLLLRYLDGTATTDERDRLSQYLVDEAGDEAWMEMMEELMSTEAPMEGYDAAQWDPFVKELRRINAAPATQPVRGRVFPLRRWAAAAAVVLVLAGGAWWWASRNSGKPGKRSVEPVVVMKDVPPGGNHAVLTLSNGRSIVLDSADNGVVTKEGNAVVRKLSNGQLAYEAAASRELQAASGEEGAASHKLQAASENVYNTLSTPKGGQYQLTLPDGSRVWLNAASSITYPTSFTGADRTVTITGEAYFEVIHNERQPFRVRTGQQIIEDIGTSFNINAYADEPAIRTTLVDGKVRVSKGSVAHVLSPGEQVSLQGGNFGPVLHADVQQVLAWKNGIFSFHDADLSTVMRQLARWYDIEVAYEGAVPGGTFDGEIGRSLTLSQVLQGLAQTRIHYDIINNHKIIIRP